MQSQLSERVLTVCFGRPEKLNALNRAEWEELRALLQAADSDERVGAVHLLSRGRVFCAGADLVDIAGLVDRQAAREYFLGPVLGTFEVLADLATPLVASVQGPALGAGVELLLFCDVVVATESADMSLPELSVGVFPTVFVGAGPSLIGARQTKRLALLGRPWGAREAVAAGIVDEIVEPERSESVGRARAENLAGRPSAAVGATKRYVHGLLRAEGMAQVRTALQTLADDVRFSEEAQRLLRQFLERRSRRESEERGAGT